MMFWELPTGAKFTYLDEPDKIYTKLENNRIVGPQKDRNGKLIIYNAVVLYRDVIRRDGA